ncbi:MAG: SprT family zinc-dependent metalloprotease [Gammaproteobacteria bacterium]|nr:SprT family zinc-dependent metalloprotease [Gammaproteobacteria bacterium]
MMDLKLDDVDVKITQKKIKHAYLSVSAPYGHVKLSVPKTMPIEKIHAFVISKLKWIKKQKAKFIVQEHEAMNIHHGPGDLKKQALLDASYKKQLIEKVNTLIPQWEKIINVSVSKVTIRKMRTRWGSCSPKSRSIRINLELAKKPFECLEYVVVHELVHLLEASHNKRFVALMDRFLPKWRFYRNELNRLQMAK